MTTTGTSAERARRGRWVSLATAIALIAGAFATSPAGARGDGVVPDPAAAYQRRSRNAEVTGAALFDSRARGSAVIPDASVARAQRALANELGAQAVVDVDERTGTPRTVARLDGFLTGPSDAAPARVTLDYVRANLRAFGLSADDLAGLRLVKDYEDILGTHHLLWQQVVRGIPVWDNDLRAHVTSEGHLIAVGGSPLPAATVATNVPRLSSREAIAAAYRSVGTRAPSLAAPTRAAAGPRRSTLFASGDDASLVLFGTGRGPRLAWRTTAFVSSREVLVSIVDARTGEILWRANMVRNDQAGTGQAWEYYPSTTVSNGGGVQHTVTFPVADGTALRGNNARAFPDTNDDNRPDRQIPASSGLDWSYPATIDTTDATNACSEAFPCTWQRGVPFSWEPNVEANTVQVFHYLNAFHDHLLAPPIGFTEAAGNFQVDNLTGQGEDGDPVVANVMDGADTRRGRPGLPDSAHVFNANMFTPPDGERPLMQMYLFPSIPSAGIPSTNGGDDGGIVYHEYTHGLSNRLVTFPDGSGAVNSAQAAAMGEAWSDFYAMDFLVSQGFQADSPTAADVIIGYYSGGGLPNFIRSEAIDCRVAADEPNCPGGIDTGPGGYTYGDFGHIFFGPEVHADGEIWVQTLWDVRTALGSDATLALVTRAMELSPPEPSFLDMRNAILQADLVAFGGAHTTQLWSLFAQRGMGFFATAIDGNDIQPEQDFSVPPVCPESCGTITGEVVDTATGLPVDGVTVGIAGHASGLFGDLSDITGADGRYTIEDVPFHDYVLTVESDIHEPVAVDVNVDGDEIVPIDVTRDWASLAGGARLKKFTGPDYTPACGPRFAWDASLSTGWGSDHPDFDGSGTTGPRINVVRLPEAIDITGFGFATAGTCGDGPEAAVRVFEIQTKKPGGSWVRAYRRSGPLPLGEMNTLLPQRGSKRNVVLVKLIMLDNYGDPLFMDMLELSVRGTPH